MAEANSKGASAPVISRELAYSLNPLIDDKSSTQTLGNVSGVLSDFGYLLSMADAEMDFDRVFRVTQVMCAALDYEAAFIAMQGRATSKGGSDEN